MLANMLFDQILTALTQLFLDDSTLWLFVLTYKSFFRCWVYFKQWFLVHQQHLHLFKYELVIFRQWSKFVSFFNLLFQFGLDYLTIASQLLHLILLSSPQLIVFMQKHGNVQV